MVSVSFEDCAFCWPAGYDFCGLFWSIFNMFSKLFRCDCSLFFFTISLGLGDFLPLTIASFLGLEIFSYWFLKLFPALWMSFSGLLFSDRWSLEPLTKFRRSCCVETPGASFCRRGFCCLSSSSCYRCSWRHFLGFISSFWGSLPWVYCKALASLFWSESEGIVFGSLETKLLSIWWVGLKGPAMGWFREFIGWN